MKSAYLFRAATARIMMVGMKHSAFPSVRIAAAFAALLSASMLGGCVGAAIGGAATVGVAAYDERGIDGVANDLKLAADIRTEWLAADADLPVKASVEVHGGRALLTGVLQDEKRRANAVALAWKVPGVKEVLNEIQVAPSGGVVDFSRDAWITGQIKAKMTFDEKIMGINFHVQTVNKTVYMIGVARSQDELNRVMTIARSISYVQNVIQHIRIKAPKTS